MNFNILEEELVDAIAADKKYERENSAKFRAVEQMVSTYEEFRDIVKASHLRPLDKKEKILDPNVAQKNVIWNIITKENPKEEPIYYPKQDKKKHFTEK